MRAFHFLRTEYAVQTLQTQEVKVSRFDDLNDPFELYGVELKTPAHRRTFERFKRWASETFGLLCFSRGCRNPLLWSHYADRHRGVALEFEIDDDHVSKVQYSPHRLRMDIERKVEQDGFSEDDAYRMAVTKSAHWRYEDEVRVFLSLRECRYHNGLFFEPLGQQLHIVGIVLGPLCQLSLEEVEHALPSGRPLRLTRSRLAFTSFNVVPNRRAEVKRLIHGLK